MRKIPKEWLLLIVIAILVIIIGIFQWNKTSIQDRAPAETILDRRSSPSGGGINTKLENEEGNVTVAVEYLKDKSQGNNMVFEIVLDTHSVNLDAFDFQKDVRLEKDGKSSPPIAINPSGSGHHRKAEVTFSRVAAPLTVVVMNASNIARREFQFTNI